MNNKNQPAVNADFFEGKFKNSTPTQFCSCQHVSYHNIESVEYENMHKEQII